MTLKMIGREYSCADKSKAYIEVVYNPENHVVGVFIPDDEQGGTNAIALRLEDARALAADLLRETREDWISLVVKE